MKKLLFTAQILLTIVSCSSRDNNKGIEENQDVISYDVPITPIGSSVDDSIQATPSQVTTNEPEQPTNVNTNSADDYNSGYKFGYDMGTTAARNHSEYNPYLPVGPNARTYSIEYRQGYAAGYSNGYGNVQQANCQEVNSEEDYSAEDYLDEEDEEEDIYYDDDF